MFIFVLVTTRRSV